MGGVGGVFHAVNKRTWVLVSFSPGTVLHVGRSKSLFMIAALPNVQEDLNQGALELRLWRKSQRKDYLA